MDTQVFRNLDGQDCACDAALLQLTPVQMRILDGVRSGQLNKQIAFSLGIAEATVKAHMTTIMRKLNVHNRTQAALAVQAMKYREVSAV